jgi:hypothetical protein
VVVASGVRTATATARKPWRSTRSVFAPVHAAAGCGDARQVAARSLFSCLSNAACGTVADVPVVPAAV